MIALSKMDLRVLLQEKTFSKEVLFAVFRENGYKSTEDAFTKRLTKLVKAGEICRVGRNQYCLPVHARGSYEHTYSQFANEVASLMEQRFPLGDFSVFELIQLNDFVNHQLAHNAIFLYVEADLLEFVFEELRDSYFGRVLLEPTPEMYHRYWCEDMIVIRKRTTEAPAGAKYSWHTDLEKMLVDLLADALYFSIISQGEYAGIYQEALATYWVDESKMLRYASRRGAKKKLLQFLEQETTITLQTERK